MTILDSILLVDDDHPTNFLHKRTLRKMGYTGDIHEAYDAEEGLKLLANDPPLGIQLVLLDLNMPRVNGWEFVERYARDLPHSDSIIVILTTSLNPDDEKRAISSQHVAAFHRKPLSREVVEAIVDTRFKGFRQADMAN